jgi:lysophospholipase L1-like esterase
VTDAPYPRADPAGAEYLPADVWSAAQLPVGVRLELIGNARTIRVWYETRRASLGYRGESAGCSFVAYRGGQKVAADEAVMGEGMAELVMSGRTELPVTVYLPEGMAPLITGVAGVEEAMVPAPLQPRWLAYGDAVTQGWLASAPAMAWPAVAGRKLGLDVCNFGYAGSARGETTSALLLAETPAEVISVAFGLNNWSRVPHTVPLMVEEVRCFLSVVRQSHPEVPIVVVSPTARPDAEETPNRVGASLSELRQAMEETVRQCIAAGDTMLFLVEGLSVVDPEHLEDGIYPGDEGHRRLAAAVSKILLPFMSDLQAAAEKRWANEGVPQTVLSTLRTPRPDVPTGDVTFSGLSFDLPDIAVSGGSLLDDPSLEAPLPDEPLDEELLDDALLDDALLDDALLDEPPANGASLDGLPPDEAWRDQDRSDEVFSDEMVQDDPGEMLQDEMGQDAILQDESLAVDREVEIGSAADVWSVDESWAYVESDDELSGEEVPGIDVSVDKGTVNAGLSDMESLDLGSLGRTSLNEALLDALSSTGQSLSATEIESPEFESPEIGSPEFELAEVGSVKDGSSSDVLAGKETSESVSAEIPPEEVEQPEATRPDIASLYNEQLEFTSLFEDQSETPAPEEGPIGGEAPNISPAEKALNGSSANGGSTHGESAHGSSSKGDSPSESLSDSPADLHAPSGTEADAREPTTVARMGHRPDGTPVDISIADMVVAALSIATNGADDVIVRHPAADSDLEWAEAVDPSS